MHARTDRRMMEQASPSPTIKMMANVRTLLSCQRHSPTNYTARFIAISSRRERDVK